MHRILRLSALFVLAAVAVGASPRKDLTVAEALRPGAFGGHQPQHVTWMPGGKAFSFFDPAGPGEASDLMACDAATLARTVLVSQAEFREAYGKAAGLQGDALSKAAFTAYAFSPKGTFLVIPMPDGAYLWDLHAKRLQRLTTADDDGDTLALSPDEARAAFISHGSLVALDVKTGARTALAQGKEPALICGGVDWLYGEELDLDRGFWWSPDGTKIAYLTFDETGVYQDPLVDESTNHPEVKPQFYPRPGDALPKVSLHCVEAAGGPSRDIPGAFSGEGYLPRACWLPGSQGLLYALYNRNQDRLSLYRAALNGDAATPILEEHWPTWVNVPEAPRFLKDGRFLWLSERDGYTHLYLSSMDGKPPRQLTKGPWVVDEILGLDEDEKEATISGNRDGALGCQVFRVNLEGGEPRRVTPAEGWHRGTPSPDGLWLLDSASSAARSDVLSLISVKDGSGRAVAENPSPELAEYGFVAPEFADVKAPDGTVLHASILKPRDFDASKKYPAIVEVYGGPHAQIVQDRWSGRWAPIYQLFAQHGFVVFAVDGRGSARRGKAFEDVLFKRLGKAELDDQLAGLKALQAFPYVDGSRVGLWGWSYGGFMTLYALTHSNAYRCGFAVAAVSDWLNYDACYTERYLKLPKDNSDGYKDSSPVNAASGLKVSLFMAQGLMDDNVHFENCARMTDALLKEGKTFGQAFYPRMNHGIREQPARTDLFTRLLTFFEGHLKAGR